MPSSSNHQNNNIASQTVTLPRSYLCYLTSKTSKKSNVIFGSDFKSNFFLFPGIKIKEPDEETIEVLIHKQTLPRYCQSTQTQAVILNALQTLASISMLSADVINPEAQKQIARPIHEALEKYLLLENSKCSISNSKEIALLSFRISITLALITAYLVLLSPLVIPAALAMAMSIFIVSSLVGMIVTFIVQDINELTNAASISKQAKNACDELDNVIRTAKGEINHLSPKKPGTPPGPQVPSSAAAAVVVNEPSCSSKRSESPTRTPAMFQPPVASANSPVEQSDAEQENTAAKACHA